LAIWNNNEIGLGAGIDVNSNVDRALAAGNTTNTRVAKKTQNGLAMGIITNTSIH